jgi:hypothetical protein
MQNRIKDPVLSLIAFGGLKLDDFEKEIIITEKKKPVSSNERMNKRNNLTGIRLEMRREDARDRY